MWVSISKVICWHAKLVRGYNTPIWDKSNGYNCLIWRSPFYLASYKMLIHVCPNRKMTIDHNGGE